MQRKGAAPAVLLGALLLLTVAPRFTLALKLRFDLEECMTVDAVANVHFFGSFVAQPNAHGYTPMYFVRVIAPSGHQLYQSNPATEMIFSSPAQFSVPEIGRYRFCIVASGRSGAHSRGRMEQ